MLYVKNITPSQEKMTNGNFSLVVRYTPTGGNPDGSEDICVQAYDVESGDLQYDEGADVQFYLSELIPIENYESVKCMLIFKGKLGNEENAVIGKTFSLGEIKFNEEWDNGLNGNYPWTHTTPDENPDNGSTSNVIDNGILVKDNIRYIGYDKPRFNSSNLDFVDLNNPIGLLITPDTYLQFKIDDLSINEIPPAPEGSTTAWQYLRLRLNNELGLQFTQEGQGVYWGSNTAYYTFNLGWIIVVNIHALFQNNGIAIPEPFYLESIGLTQQLWNIGEFSTVEHRQHMEVDFMRIVERYVEPESKGKGDEKMIISVKTTKKLLAVIGLAAFILSSPLSWAGDMVFADYSVSELKVVEVNIEATTVILESPDGDTATLMVGDAVGQEGSTIIEIRELMIIMEGPPDESGKVTKSYIPVIRIGTPSQLVPQ